MPTILRRLGDGWFLNRDNLISLYIIVTQNSEVYSTDRYHVQCNAV
jgi:hypothetical protein